MEVLATGLRLLRTHPAKILVLISLGWLALEPMLPSLGISCDYDEGGICLVPNVATWLAHIPLGPGALIALLLDLKLSTPVRLAFYGVVSLAVALLLDRLLARLTRERSLAQ